MKLVRMFTFLSALTFCLLIFGKVPLASASFNANRIIDDPIFDNAGTMDANQINSFLNGFSNSCISPNSGFDARIPSGYSPSSGFSFGDFVTAGQVIHQAALVYSINPQVLLVTLQKEQSLVSGGAGYCNDGSEHKYAAAVGYGCPDSGGSYSWSGISLYRRNGVERTNTGSTCVNSAVKAGFSQQVIRAAWLLKFGEQRSKGNMNWAVTQGNWDNSDDPQSCYSGPMTQGSWQVCPSGPTTYYDGYRTIDNTAVHIDTGGTAALYWYTPHFHGNQNFASLFESWFGATRGDYCVGSSSSIITAVGFRSFQSNLSLGNFIIYSGTSTNCVESHAWDVGFNSWKANTASNLPVVNPANSVVKFADLSGNGRDNPILIGVNGTQNSKIEFHVWNYDMKSWMVHAESNLTTAAAQDIAIEFADLYGTGRKEPVAIKYKNLSNTCPDGVTHNCVELHTWNPGLQSWKNHIITNLPGPLDPDPTHPNAMQIGFADVDRNGVDEGVAIGLSSTTSNNIEFHVWAPGQWAWQSHINSGQPTTGTGSCSVQFADLDTDRIDNAILVCPQGTSSGKIEFHVWNPGMYTWQGHYQSNQPSL